MRKLIQFYTPFLLLAFLTACDNPVTHWSYTDSSNATHQRNLASLVYLDDNNQAYVSGVQFELNEPGDQVEQSISLKRISDSNLSWERKISSTINGGIEDIRVARAFPHLVVFDSSLNEFYFASTRFYTLDDLQSDRTHEIVLIKLNNSGDLLWDTVISKDASQDDYPIDLSLNEGILTLAFNREEDPVSSSTWLMQFDTEGTPLNKFHLEESQLDSAVLNHNGVSLLATNVRVPPFGHGIKYVTVDPTLNRPPQNIRINLLAQVVFIRAFMQRSLSPCIACAVSAMIGSLA